MTRFDALLRHQQGLPGPVFRGYNNSARANVQQNRFKAGFLNKFIRGNHVASVIEIGCAEGRLLRQLRVAQYIGVALSASSLSYCQTLAKDDAARMVYGVDALPGQATAALALSVDIINRLGQELDFNTHMRLLFQYARDFAVVYAGQAALGELSCQRRLANHVKRFFPGWALAAQVPNPFHLTETAGGGGDFFIYTRQGMACTIPIVTSA